MKVLKRALLAATLAATVGGFVPATASAQPTAPTITAGPANPSADPAPSFTYTSSYTQVTFECQLDAGGYSACPGFAYGGATSGTQSYSGVVDGTHTFAVRALDLFGTAGPSATFAWLVDRVAPALSLPASITVQSPLGRAVFVSYSVTATDNHDASPSVSCDHPRTGGTFALGSTTVQCTAGDAAGNAAGGSFTVSVLDSTAPKTPTFTSRPANPSADTAPSFAYKTNEPATFSCRLDAGPFAACGATSSLTGLADGSHTFSVHAVDPSGNVSQNATYAWIVDTIAPTLALPAPIVVESPFGFPVLVQYVVSTTDNHDPNPQLSCTYPMTGAVFSLGTTSVICTGTDWVGNSATSSFTVDVQDTTAPNPPWLSGPSDPSNNASPSFWYGTNEWNANFECSLDGAAFAACAQGYTSLSGLADGSHTFAVRATDVSGNVSSASSFSWVIDTVAPVLTVPGALLAQSPLGNSVQVPYTVSATDNADSNPTVYCNYGNAGGWFGVGTTTVSCSAYDKAGNSATASFNVTVEDHVAPDAPHINGPSDPTNNASPSLSFWTNEWNVTWECSLDGAPWTACPSYISYTGLADGSHTFQARATDASGNVGAAGSYTWVSDTVPPVITVPGPLTAQSPFGDYVRVSYTVSATDDRDPNPSLWCNPGGWFPVGTTTVTCTSYDKAGNSSSASFTVTVVDTTAPDPPQINGPWNPSNNPSPTFWFSTSEWNVTWECSLDGAAYTACQSYATFSGLADGAHTLVVRATDASGNVSAPSSYSWVIDTAAPVITAPGPLVAQSPLGNSVHVSYVVSATDTRDPNPSVYCSYGNTGGWFAVGTSTVTCYAYDNAGNWAYASFTVTVQDASPPNAPQVFGPSSPTTSTSASFWFSTNEWNVTWECSLDGAPFASCGWGYTSLAGLADGDHTLAVRATDAAGNVSPVTTYAWTVDLAAPVLSVPASMTIESPDGSDAAVSYTVSAVDAHDPNPTVVCTNGGATGGTFAPGTTTVDCTAHDWLGNTSSIASFTVTVQDTTAPDAPTIAARPPDPSGAQTATFDYFTSEPDVTYYCSLDNAVSSVCSPPVTYNGLADGLHTFSVYAVDDAGNVGAPTTVTWLVDLGSPSVTGPGALNVESPLGTDANVSYTVGATDAHDPHPALVCDHGTRAGGTFPLGTTTTVTCTGTDWVGKSSSTSFTVTVADTTPPVAPAINGPADPSKVASPTIGYSTNERNASFQCRLDGAPFAACPASANGQGTDGSIGYSGLADGAHTFQVLAVDSSGNTGPAATHSWTIDLVAPVVTVPATQNVESPLGADAAVSYTVSAADNHDPGPTIACDHGTASGGTFPLGTTIVSCTSSDAAGNTSAPQSFTVDVVDTTAPAPPTITSRPSDPSGLDSASFSYGTNEPATFECSLDGAGFTGCGSTASYGGLADGVHTFQVRAIDSSGNVGSPTAAGWTVDLVAPVITVPGAMSAESALGGVIHVAYTVSAADNHDASPTIACDHGSASGGDFGLGTTTVTCTSRDAAGNTSAPQSFTVDVTDTTAPGAPSVTGPPNPSNSTAPTFSYSTDEQNATFECSLDGAALGPCGSTASFTGLADGVHTFQVRAIDSSGNVGSIATFTWTVDTVAPTTTITAQPVDPTADPAPSFGFVADEPASFECQLDGGGFAPCTDPAGYSGLAPGLHTFEVRAIDLAGNVGPVVGYSWTQT